MTLNQLELDFFSARLGRRFRIPLPDGLVELRLDEVNPVKAWQPQAPETIPGAAAPGLRSQPFSIIFLGPPTPLLPQRIYEFHGEPDEAAMEIFIVPVGRNADGITYEAVFG
jgi:hypothetical protein